MTTRRAYHARPRPARRPQPTDSTAHNRGRLIVALDGRSWTVADDLDTERELRELAERLALVLVEYVGAA